MGDQSAPCSAYILAHRRRPAAVLVHLHHLRDSIDIAAIPLLRLADAQPATSASAEKAPCHHHRHAADEQTIIAVSIYVALKPLTAKPVGSTPLPPRHL